MKLAIYLAAVPKNKNHLKIAVLKNFGEGAKVAGNDVEFVLDSRVINSEVAVIQGFVHQDISSPHLALRRQILDSNKRTVVIDSNLFQFANPDLANFYLRYSLNGVFPTTGFYFDNLIDETRWTKISRRLGITVKDYRSNGNHILICTQRVDGWSMCGNDVQVWLDKTVKQLRKFTQRPIKIRRHPGDRRQNNLIAPQGTVFSETQFLSDDLNNAWATVTFNSSPGVASLIHGVPVFVTDDTPARSQTWPICNTDLSMIEGPVLHDRKVWLDKLSQSHWNDEEVRSGEAWAFMRDRLRVLEPNLC